MADFKTRTPAIDPMAFANVLQRKAQMEQEQINKEIDRKNDRFKRITDAVIAGQTIASNMMTLADKRNEMKQKKLEQEAQANIADIASRPPAIPTEEPSLDPKVNQQRMEALAAERQRELMSNIARSKSAEKYNEALIEKALPKTDSLRGNALDSGNLSVKFKGEKERRQVKGTYDKINRRLYDWTGKDITDQVEDVAPAFAPYAAQLGSGEIDFRERTPGERVSTASDQPDKVDGKTLKTNVNQLHKLEVERLEKLKEDFNTDKAVSAALTKQGDYEVASAAIETGNWVGDAALISVAAKGLGRDVGNLSAEEQERYRASPQIIQKIKSKISRWTQGIIPEEDREAFREALRVAREKNDYIIEKKRDIYGRTAANRIKDLDPEFAKSYIYEYNPLTEKKDIDAAIEDFFNNPTGE